jgi:hypothetical protein
MNNTIDTTSSNEIDTRKQIIQSILTSPHGKLDELAKLHLTAFENDPDFYQHFACWYEDKGTIRDHKNLFAAKLLTSPYEFRNIGYDMRAVGKALANQQPVRQFSRTIKTAKELFTGAPRYLKSTVEMYLRQLEDSDFLDIAIMLNKKPLKYLYASLHIKPCEYVQQCIFENNPPENSDTWAVKQLAQASPVQAAELITYYNIPYLVAVGAVKQITPVVSISLINQMTPQQLLNNLKSIEKKGLLNDKDVKQLVEDKIESAKKDKRVATLKTDVVGKQVKQFSKQLKEVRDKKVDITSNQS